MSAKSSSVTASKSPSFGRDVARFLARYWLPLLVLVLAVIFIAQNTTRTTVHFLMFSVTTPMWVMLLIVVIAGIVIGWFARRYGRRRSAE